jgi:hypothetical protein
MRRLFVLTAAAATLVASGAFAGEVKGPPGDPDNPVHNTNVTAAPAHANSACAFSGLNDFDGAEGQQVSQVQTAADAFKFYGYPHGIQGRIFTDPDTGEESGGLCRGGTNEGHDHDEG